MYYLSSGVLFMAFRKRWLIALCLLFITIITHGQELSPVDFEDQHGDAVAFDSNVKWLIFAHHNKGAKMTKEAIDQVEINDFTAYQGLYVADISKMPALISRMFAMPAMRNYEFNLALDKDGDITQNWPKQDDKVTLITLDNLSLVDVQYVDSPEEIVTFIEANR